MHSMFINRHITERIAVLSKQFPVIGIIGPRQVGKTTLVKEYAKEIDKPTLYLDLERPSDFDKLKEAELFLSDNQNTCVILDEIQRLPDLFPLLRSLVDEYRTPLRFIILGSANPALLKYTSETLAGRIGYVELGGFNYQEIKQLRTMRKHHFYGGFPEALLQNEGEYAKQWLDNFILTYLERDLPLLGLPASPQVTRKLWEMLAWQNGNILNYNSIARSLGISYHTVSRYIDFLESAFLVSRLQPFHFNIRKRLVKSPKILLRDSGVLHRLLRIENYEQLLGNPLVGNSWESYAVEQIRTLRSSELSLYFYRTHAGAEIDLVLARGLQPVAAIEVKFSATPDIDRGMLASLEDLKTNNNFIITPRSGDYRPAENIRVCSLKVFLEHYLATI